MWVRKTGVGSLLMMALICPSDGGRVERLQSYEIEQRVICETQSARIVNARLAHALWRDCEMSVIPPFHSCMPAQGMNGAFYVFPKRRGTFSGTMEKYELLLRGTQGIIRPCEPSAVPDKSIYDFSIDSSGHAMPNVMYVRFCELPEEAAGLALHIAGGLHIGEETELFDCTVPLEYNDTGYQCTDPSVME